MFRSTNTDLNIVSIIYVSKRPQIRKDLNYRVLDLFFLYNFHINFFFIRVCLYIKVVMTSYFCQKNELHKNIYKSKKKSELGSDDTSRPVGPLQHLGSLDLGLKPLCSPSITWQLRPNPAACLCTSRIANGWAFPLSSHLVLWRARAAAGASPSGRRPLASRRRTSQVCHS